ncbi:MAG: M48 family metallopeptidase [Candidatus Margulisbacteria bacterium]|nr:M48 family metallopeptidase [Candidatus Margulisiibacteriota bacterium]
MIDIESVILKPNKRRHTYSIEINGDAHVVLRTPMRPSQHIIRQLLNDHQPWIQKHQQKQVEINKSLPNWDLSTHVHIRGHCYRIQSNTESPTVIQANGQLWLPEHLPLQTVIESTAKDYLPKRCMSVASNMGLAPSAIKIRRMRSCWGTCHSNGTITLNLSLIHAPDWVSDYVIIHECAHLVHFNHSPNFWALVETHTPHTKAAKLWLKKHQSVLSA